jgi:glycerate kinase
MVGADLVITGEGRLDSQSFQGKVVGYMSAKAEAEQVSIAYCVGSNEGNFPSQSLGGVSLSELAGSSALAMQNPEKYLIEAGVQLSKLL